jgi:cytochrome c551/c552
MMARALRAGDKAEELNADEMETILSDFTDKENINNWAKNDLALAVKMGTVNGQTPIIMAPQAALSRAEAAVMVSRYWRK